MQNTTTTEKHLLIQGIDKFYNDKEAKRSYTRDKRVKHWDICDCCKTSISRNMAKVNQGYCGVCIEMYQ